MTTPLASLETVRPHEALPPIFSAIPTLKPPFTYSQLLEHHYHHLIPSLRALYGSALTEPTSWNHLIDSLQYPDDIDHAKLFLTLPPHQDSLHILLSLGADPNVRDTVGQRERGRLGRTLLEIAVSGNDVETVRFLVNEANVDLMQETMAPSNLSPLEWVTGMYERTEKFAARDPEQVAATRRHDFKANTGRSLSADMEIRTKPTRNWSRMKEVLEKAVADQRDGRRSVQLSVYLRVRQEVLAVCWAAEKEGRGGEDACVEVQTIEERGKDGLREWRSTVEKVRREIVVRNSMSVE